MPPKRLPKQPSPPLKAFGTQVRHYREQRGLTQERLAAKFPVTATYIGQIENGKTRCTPDFAEQLDESLQASGGLVKLWHDLVKSAVFPSWFDWPGLVDPSVVSYHAFQLSVVHGLLQTPEYCSVLFDGDEEKVEARMKRKELLDRKDPPPPELVVILDECVLYREIGNREITREQLAALPGLVSPRVAIQVAPARFHKGVSGSFTLVTLEDRSQLAYVEGPSRGFTLSDSEDLSKMAEALSNIRAKALPVDQSMALVNKVVADRWM